MNDPVFIIVHGVCYLTQKPGVPQSWVSSFFISRETLTDEYKEARTEQFRQELSAQGAVMDSISYFVQDELISVLSQSIQPTIQCEL